MIVAHPKPQPIPAPVADERPAGCTLSETIACWVRRRRELLADLAGASGSPDAEVLRADLRAAEEQSDYLLALALGWAA